MSFLKKYLSVLPAVLLLAAIFTGCGSSLDYDQTEIDYDNDLDNEYYDDLDGESHDNDDWYDEENDDENGSGSGTTFSDTDSADSSPYTNSTSATVPALETAFDPSVIPPRESDDEEYSVINDNTPYFTSDQITDESYEYYSDLDQLGRCGPAVACAGQDLMPTEKRGDISSVKPTGWVQKKYDCVSGGSLYNRSHLIAYELTGENANEKNLITGCEAFNQQYMQPFENLVADYIKETDNHVMYRVTPVFEGDNLVADGVLMEALSVEDNGDGVEYCVFVYNFQPGIVIDYATGDSHEA